MNKPQYLAELDRLLIFMTSADRAKTLDRIGALFDKAGPEGVDSLLKKLGTPTSEAIRLSRVYNPFDGYEDKFLDGLEQDAGLDAAPAPEPEPGETETEPEPIPAEPEPTEAPPAYTVPALDLDDIPGFEPPPIPPNFVENEPEPKSEPEPEPEPEPESEGEPGPAEDENGAPPSNRDDIPDWMSGKDTSAPEDRAEEVPAAPAEPAAEASEPEPAVAKPLSGPVTPSVEPEPSVTAVEPAYTVERVMPLAAGIPVFILALLAVALPLALVCLVLAPVLVLPGVALLLGAWLAAVGGLWCISYMADAVMLFGVALVALAAALVALWLGLWLLVSIVSLYIRGLKALAHLTLGKKVQIHA